MDVIVNEENVVQVYGRIFFGGKAAFGMEGELSGMHKLYGGLCVMDVPGSGERVVGRCGREK